MNGHFKSGQRGISFFGLLFVGGVLACVVLVGLQVFPTYMEYLAVEKAVRKAANEGTTVAEIRSSFDRTAAIDNIETIKGTDLDISKQGEKVVVTFAYTREIELVGPAFLLMKYSGSSR
ncbi:DUF4845 domain-containing protein [Variovorax sp. VNK109]|jgi:hypothetical protein|uniref:DUF4845 domain-containing protein n=1 Tax=Variovorax sp. VNK109 TaxID=3400919 RepID=UPI003C0D9686